MTLSYPATLEPETRGRGYVVKFSDLPEALTGGRTLSESLHEAADCLGSALAFRMLDQAGIPLPSKTRKGQIPVQVPFSVAPKVALYMAMRHQGTEFNQTSIISDKSAKVRESSLRRKSPPSPGSSFKNF